MYNRTRRSDAEMGRYAVKLLLLKVRSEDAGNRGHEFVTELVQSSSTGNPQGFQ